MAAFFIMVAMFGTYYGFGVFFKPVLTDFGWTRAMTSGAFSLSMIMYGLLGIVMGGLTDRFGPRLVMTLCGFLLGLGYLLMSQISSVWQLYIYYGVIIGIGISGGYVPQVSTVARWFVKRRGLAVSITLAGFCLGGIIWPPSAQWLITIYGWRQCFTILGILSLLVIIPLSQFAKHSPQEIGLSSID